MSELKPCQDKLIALVRERGLIPYMRKFKIGREYTTLDIPGDRIPVAYTLEWIDLTEKTHGVALWRAARGTLHLQNIVDFQEPPK